MGKGELENQRTPNQSVSLEQVIRAQAERLEQSGVCFAHGTDNALDESAWLVLEAVGLSPVDEVDYQQLLSQAAQQRAAALITRRIDERLPAAYLVGRTWFAGLEFHADQRALVPRSPLAEPILERFADLLEPEGVKRVLDLCTGGGCIALACAHAFPSARIDASDLSAEALSLAHQNQERYPDSPVNWYQGDLWQALPPEARYDLIVSNPPYVDARDMHEAASEFDKEPRMGLVAGDDGLDIVRRILKQAADYLAPEGWLVVEVGNSAEAVDAAWPELPIVWLGFSQGGDGVFALQREWLIEHAAEL